METKIHHLMNCCKRITLFKSIIKTLQALVMEMYKLSGNVSSTILNDISAPRATPYNLRNPVRFKIQKVQSACNSSETLSHLQLKIFS